MVLASETVGGRSRATELPCFTYMHSFHRNFKSNGNYGVLGDICAYLLC